MRKWILAVIPAIILICALLLPVVSFTEDEDTIHLARVIYALGRAENYETKVAIGSVVMNRVDSVWFGDTLSDVLDDPQQFPSGERYDAESLKAAHAVMSGKRNLDHSILYYDRSDIASTRTPVAAVGGYDFFTTNTMLTVTGLL